MPDEALPSRCIVRQAYHEGVARRVARRAGLPYGMSNRCDFVLVIKDAVSTDLFPVAPGEILKVHIEAKFQSSVGTNWQKLPHSILDLRFGGVAPNGILLLDGPRFTPQLHRLATELAANLRWDDAPVAMMTTLQVMHMQQFKEWLDEVAPLQAPAE